MTFNSPGGLKKEMCLLCFFLCLLLAELFFQKPEISVSADEISHGKDFYISLENGDGVWYAEHNKGSAAVGTIHYMTVGVRFYTLEGRGAEFSVMRGSGLSVVDKAETAEYGEIYKTYYTVEGLSANSDSDGILELLIEEAGLSRGEDHIFYADQIITVYRKTDNKGGKKILQTGITDRDTFLRAANWSSNTKACCEQMFNRKIILERKSVQIWLGFFTKDSKGNTSPISVQGSSVKQLNGMVGYGSVYSFKPNLPQGYPNGSQYEVDPEESFAAVSKQSVVTDLAMAMQSDTVDVFYSDGGILSLYVSDSGNPAYICVWVALRARVPVVTPTPQPVKAVRVYTEYITDDGYYIDTGDMVELMPGSEFIPYLPDVLTYRGREYSLGAKAYAVESTDHTGDWCSYDERELYEKVNIDPGYKVRIPVGVTALKIFVAYIPVPYSFVTVVIHSIDAYSCEEISVPAQVILSTGEDAVLYVDREKKAGDRVYVVSGDDPVSYPAKAINCTSTVLLECAYMISNPNYFTVNNGPLGYGPVYFDVSDDLVRPMYIIDTHDTDVRWMHVFIPYKIAIDLNVRYIDGDLNGACDIHGIVDCSDCELLGQDVVHITHTGEYCYEAPGIFCCENGDEKHLLQEGALALYGLRYCYGVCLPSGMRVETCRLCKGSGVFCGSICFQCNGTGEDCFTNLRYVNHYEQGSSEYKRFEENKGSLICCDETNYSCCSACDGTGRRSSCTCPVCKGLGHDDLYRRCSACNGTGQYTLTVCYECKGDPVCRSCQGTGKKRIWEPGHSYMGNCPTCGGSGRYCSACKTTGRYDPYRCQNCKGVGYFEGIYKVCSRCHGEGYFLCTRCNGTGWIGSEPCTACGGVHITFVNSLGNEMTRISKGQGVIRCECYQYAGAYDGDDYQRSYGWVCASTRCTVCGHRTAGRLNQYGTYDYELGGCTCNYEINLSYSAAYRSSYSRTPVSVEPQNGQVTISIPEFRGGGVVAYLVYQKEGKGSEPAFTVPIDHVARADIRIDTVADINARIRRSDGITDPLGILAGCEVNCEAELPDGLLSVQLRNIVGRMPYVVHIERPYIIISHDDHGEEYQADSGTEYCTVTVSMPYSYWKIGKLEYYDLVGVSMNSISERGRTLFEEPIVMLYDNEETEGEVSASADRACIPLKYDLGGGVYGDGEITIKLETLVLTGRGTVIPELPKLTPENAEAYAYRYLQSGAGDMVAMNDTLIYGGRVVMDSELSSGKTKDPVIANLGTQASRVSLTGQTNIPPDTTDGKYYAEPSTSYADYVLRDAVYEDESEIGRLKSVRLYQNTVTIYGGVGKDIGLHGLRLIRIDETDEWPISDDWTVDRLPLIGIVTDEDGITEDAFLKAGYTWRFEICALNDDATDTDVSLSITPSYRWISADGQESEPVDIYYHAILEDGYHALICAGEEIIRIDPQTDDRVTDAERRFTFSCRLPALFHVCPKGFDAVGYTSARGMISYREPFWKKKGYLLMCLDIRAIRCEADGTMTECGSYDSVWAQEGFQTARVLLDGTVLTLEPGEIVLMRVDRSRADDYVVERNISMNY